MNVQIVRIASDRIHVECYDANGCYETSLHSPFSSSSVPVVNAVIQGDRIVITSADGRTAVFDRNSGGYITGF